MVFVQHVVADMGEKMPPSPAVGWRRFHQRSVASQCAMEILGTARKMNGHMFVFLRIQALKKGKSSFSRESCVGFSDNCRALSHTSGQFLFFTTHFLGKKPWYQLQPKPVGLIVDPQNPVDPQMQAVLALQRWVAAAIQLWEVIHGLIMLGWWWLIFVPQKSGGFLQFATVYRGKKRPHPICP